jgi:hypothetical protein
LEGPDIDIPQFAAVGGLITVGGDPLVLAGEAYAYAYESQDATTPIMSYPPDEPYYWGAPAGWSYWFRFPVATEVCDYWVKVVLWNGEESELTPLFDQPYSSCEDRYYPGHDFDLPPYAPVATPLILTGMVFAEGFSETVEQALVTIESWRGRARFLQAAEIHPDADGRYVFETTDRSMWLALCIGGASVQVTLANTERVAGLEGFYGHLDRLPPYGSPGAITGLECSEERRFPDVMMDS